MSTESADVPLDRGAISFDTAIVTLEGVLKPCFSGPVGKSVQDLFRPLEAVFHPGRYSVLLAGQRYTMTPSCQPKTVRFEETSALCVGGFVAVWLENFGEAPAPFCVVLRGHAGRAHPGKGLPGSDEEVGSSSVWLGMIAGEAP